jgi:hypothetical protein
MKAKDEAAMTSARTAPATKARISIMFGYPWDAKKRAVNDAKYDFLKEIIKKGTAGTETMSGEGGERIAITVARLRGKHGAPILDDIRSRIHAADVLLFDLDEGNPNVLIELGMALANHSDGKFVFILMKETQRIPSDLSGYLITYYKETQEYTLVDPQGFYAALRSAVIERAKRHGVFLNWNKPAAAKTKPKPAGKHVKPAKPKVALKKTVRPKPSSPA